MENVITSIITLELWGFIYLLNRELKSSVGFRAVHVFLHSASGFG